MMILLQALLAALHQTAVGLAAVGPVLVGVLRLRAAFRRDDSADRCLRQIAWWSTVAVVLGAVVGLAAGVLRVGVSDEYTHMLGRFALRAYYLLAAEVAFTLACYAAWLWLWERWRVAPWRHAVLAVVGATNLLYHFPPLMIAQHLLTIQPDLIADPEISRPALLSLMATPYVVAKTLHVWAAGLVIAAACQLLAVGESTTNTTLVRWTAGAGLCGVSMQMLTGVAVLLFDQPGIARRITGDALLGTVVFVVGVLLTIHVLLHLARLVVTPDSRISGGRLAAMVVCIMLAMSLAIRC